MAIFVHENIYEKVSVPDIIRKLIRPRFLLNIVSINQRASGQCSSTAYSFNCLEIISSQVFYRNLQLTQQGILPRFPYCPSFVNCCFSLSQVLRLKTVMIFGLRVTLILLRSFISFFLTNDSHVSPFFFIPTACILVCSLAPTCISLTVNRSFTWFQSVCRSV